MKKFRLLVSVLVVLLLVMSIFVGCTPQETATDDESNETEESSAVVSSDVSEAVTDEKVELTIASWAYAEESIVGTYQSMLDTFMDDNPNVSIETVSYPWAQYLDQLIISAAAGTAPDIAHIQAEWLPQFLEMAVLQNLDFVMSDELKDDYYDNILSGATVDGEIVAAPWFNNPTALYYNKTLMEKAGVTELPTNWNEMIEAARKISALGTDENGNKIYGYGLPNSKTEIGCGYNCFPHLWTYGGDFVDDNGNVVINSEENIAAFSGIRELYQDEISPIGCGVQDLRNLFAQGVIGFYYDIQMAGATFVNASPLGEDFANEYGVMVTPSMDDANGYGYITEHYLLVFNTVDESEHEAIGDFLEHMTGETVIQILYDAGMGKMPDRESVAGMEIFTSPEDEKAKTFVEALNTARPLPISGLHFMDSDELIIDALNKLATTNEPVENIVAALDAAVKELYGQ